MSCSYILIKRRREELSWARDVDRHGISIVGNYKGMRFIVKCIDTSEKVSIDIVEELNEVMPDDPNLLRIIVTSGGGFTKESLEFEKKNIFCLLTDNNHLVSDLMDRYMMIEDERIERMIEIESMIENERMFETERMFENERMIENERFLILILMGGKLTNIRIIFVMLFSPFAIYYLLSLLSPFLRSMFV
ncbi:10860_t:CDS:1 [Funneliformis caledonium]|uniref:10860_t:CDS:1 n=1 Tax=Funneliformis caledonium TaxID=1117310 RepID=A0A9N9DV80_9GLOM|nr:10860_t:CDS:1 [Funneliformis caledonium]